MTNIVLYRHPLSGHAHRVELFLRLLDLPFRSVDVDLIAREQKRPEFLAKNAFGQVPVLEDGDLVISDSLAILVYLAKTYAHVQHWLPDDPALAAEVQRWFSVAAGPLVEGPARARAIAVFGRDVDATPSRVLARQLFTTLDAHLASRSGSFFVGARPTLADVALYAYIAHSPEGGVSLAPFPALSTWIDDVQALPRFVPMKATKTAALELAE
jgi:glutathione S-transferase